MEDWDDVFAAGSIKATKKKKMKTTGYGAEAASASRIVWDVLFSVYYGH